MSNTSKPIDPEILCSRLADLGPSDAWTDALADVGQQGARAHQTRRHRQVLVRRASTRILLLAILLNVVVWGAQLMLTRTSATHTGSPIDELTLSIALGL